MANDTRLFLREFIRSPLTTGALAPSSSRLAAELCAPIPERGDPVVVELGPGTGSSSVEIQRRLGGRGHHVAVELNPRLAALLTQRFPMAKVVNGCATTLPEILTGNSLSTADVVVSGLPWAIFSEDRQRGILGAVALGLSASGAFTTFAYTYARVAPAARRFRELLHLHFEEVVTSRTVWRNLPPALVYHARRPRLA